MNGERYNPIEMPEAKPEQEMDPSRKRDPFFTGNWSPQDDPPQTNNDPMDGGSDQQQARLESDKDSMDGAEAAPRKPESEQSDDAERLSSTG